MLEVPAPAPRDEVARRLLTEAANRGEAIVSIARVLFCSLVLLRFLLGGFSKPDGTMRALVEIPALATGIVVSILSWMAARRGRITPRLLVGSTLVDSVVCFASLLSTVLWPDEGYAGLLRSPDPAAVIAVVFVTALRLTPAAAWGGTAFNVVLLLTLVGLDHRLHGPRVSYGASEVAMLLIFTGAAGVVAAVAGSVARRMVLRAGEESAGLARARWRFGELLREHHDVRTLLSSAKLRADLLLREAEGAEARPHVEAIVRDLGALAAIVEQVKLHTLGELAALEGAIAVDVTGALRRCSELVQGRFPGVRVELDCAPEIRARVMGGEGGLSHVLTNLLVNACEGDGSRGAGTIRVEVLAEGGSRVRLRVLDDGPGFRRGVLEGARPRGGSTKAQGSGIGLLLAATLVEASGGELRAGNRAEGGAEIELRLPGAG